MKPLDKYQGMQPSWIIGDTQAGSGDSNGPVVTIDTRTEPAVFTPPPPPTAVFSPPPLTAAYTPPPTQQRLIEGSSEHRKQYPMCEGLLDYFPDALAEVSNVSFVGNAKHNPGEEMHHARGKSMDHANCILRHLLERGGFDTVTASGSGKTYRIRHTAALAWRALALLQEELEQELKLPLPRGAK